MGLWMDLKGIMGLGSSAGFLKRDASGALSVDTATYVIGSGAVKRVLSANLTVGAGCSYIVVGPLEAQAYKLRISGIVRVVK